MATKKSAAVEQHTRFTYPRPDDLEVVPTVAELAKNGLARSLPNGGYSIDPIGQQMILDAMKRNGDKGRAFDESRAREREARVQRARAAAAAWAADAFAE